MNRLGAAVACIVLVSCAGRRPPTEQAAPSVSVEAPPPTVVAAMPTLRDAWHFTLLSVTPMVQRGDFVGADSALATFANAHGGTCEASESSYVRALVRLSPENSNAKPESALPLLDEYITSKCLAPGRAAEVLMVRKVAVDLGKQRAATDSASADEIKKLKDQLDLTKKELDRLKMRVIPP